MVKFWSNFITVDGWKITKTSGLRGTRPEGKQIPKLSRIDQISGGQGILLITTIATHVQNSYTPNSDTHKACIYYCGKAIGMYVNRHKFSFFLIIIIIIIIWRVCVCI